MAKRRAKSGVVALLDRRRRARPSKQNIMTIVILSGTAGMLGYYFTYDFVLWLMGIIGLFLILREVTATRAKRFLANVGIAPNVPAYNPESEQFKRMGVHELLENVVTILAAHGYQEGQEDNGNIGSGRIMRRGGRIFYVTVRRDSIDEEFINTLLTAQPKRDPSQMVIVTVGNVSRGAQRFALEREISLIDGEELFRLWSLQAKGHRVHALDPNGSRSTGRKKT